MLSHGRRRGAAIGLAVLFAWNASGYSVLSHEALIDALWDVKLKAALLKRYPQATPEQLKEAHGYAYGGAIIQDLGYYPHGSKEFSDLTHYVRTGDFIAALIKESRSLNELAFAMGALSHYVSDVDGHRMATNVGEPMLYPRLRKKFGDVITYEDNPAGHLKTEFGFDVLEIAKGNFAPEAYHDFIGFAVAEPLVGRAFRETYGLELGDVFQDFHLAVESYRHAVSKTIPLGTRVAWASRQAEIEKSQPGMTRHRFIYVMSRSSYERNWGKQYDRPSVWDRFLGWIVKLLPPIGPLQDVKLKIPTPAVEKLFMDSFDRAAQAYSKKIDEVMGGTLHFDDRNYDVGEVTAPGVYWMDDNIQAYWLGLLAKKNFSTVTPEIRAELLGYLGSLKDSAAMKKDPERWRAVPGELEQLRGHQLERAGKSATTRRLRVTASN